MRSKADTEPTTKKSKTEKKLKRKKRIFSEVSVNSPGNPWSKEEKEGYIQLV